MDPANFNQPSTNQTGQGAVVGNPNPYDFILNNKKPKRQLIDPNNKQQMYIVTIFGFIILIVLFLILKSVFAGPPVINKTYATDTLQIQQEIVHLSSQPGSGNLNNLNMPSSLTNTNSTIGLVIASEQSSLINYLKLNGISISPNVISLGINANLDNQLVTAFSNGNFNSVFKQLLINEIQKYQGYLSLTYSSSTGTHGKALLKQDYADTKLLLFDLNNTSL